MTPAITIQWIVVSPSQLSGVGREAVPSLKESAIEIELVATKIELAHGAPPAATASQIHVISPTDMSELVGLWVAMSLSRIWSVRMR